MRPLPPSHVPSMKRAPARYCFLMILRYMWESFLGSHPEFGKISDYDTKRLQFVFHNQKGNSPFAPISSFLEYDKDTNTVNHKIKYFHYFADKNGVLYVSLDVAQYSLVKGTRMSITMEMFRDMIDGLTTYGSKKFGKNEVRDFKKAFTRHIQHMDEGGTFKSFQSIVRHIYASGLGKIANVMPTPFAINAMPEYDPELLCYWRDHADKY